MSLIGLAIVGKHKEPLYLCDCVRMLDETRVDVFSHNANNDPEQQQQQQQREEDHDNNNNNDNNNATSNGIDDNDDDDNDPFGFEQAAQNRGAAESLSMEHCFVLHAALDQFDEAIETSDAGLPVPKPRTGAWLGSLVQLDERMTVYGYVTATNLKLLALVQTSGHKAMEVRRFLTEVHKHYIAYAMNPFFPISDENDNNNNNNITIISSKTFDERIASAVKFYEANRMFEA